MRNSLKTALFTFEHCGHLTERQCGACYSATVATLTALTMKAKPQGYANLHGRVASLLSVWHRRYGHANHKRVTL